MIHISRGCRIVTGLALSMAPLLVVAQRPIVSSCRVSPTTIPLGGTATVHAEATSPSGLPLQYIFSASTGTIRGDGASATYTADGSATEDVLILCEALDTHQSWTRGRAHIRVTGAASGTAAAPKQRLQEANPAAASAPKPATPKPAAPKVVVPTPSLPKPVAPRAAVPPVVMSKPSPLPPAAAPQPPPAQAKVQPVPPPPVLPQTVVPPPTEAAAPAPEGSLSDEGTGAWEKALKSGQIECDVPQTMTAGTLSQVTVTVHGPNDQRGKANGAGSTSKNLAQYTLLLLSESPGEFNIAPRGNSVVQFVPEDGSATWSWSVTPIKAAGNQKLQVRLYMQDKSDVDQDIDASSYTVNVVTPSRLEVAAKAYSDDPDKWWKYWLPSGIILILLFQWFIHRLTKSVEGSDLRDRRDGRL